MSRWERADRLARSTASTLSAMTTWTTRRSRVSPAMWPHAMPLRLRGVVSRGRFVVMSALLIGFVGCQEPAAPPAMPLMKVPVARPVTMTIVEWDQYQGRLDAVDEVEIQAKIIGYLREVHFQDGQQVKAGDLLFMIDQRPFKTDLDRAEATLRTAEARVKEAEAQLKVAQLGQTEAKSNLQLAEANLERGTRLRGTGGLSQEAIETRENEVFQASARLASAEASIAAAEAGVETSRAEVATAQANLRTANVQFGYTTIASPIDGRVGRRLVSPGDLIVGGGSGSTLLTTVVSQNPIHVYFDADQSQYLRYTRLAASGDRPSARQVHHPVYVALDDDDQGFPYLGHMDFVDNRLDQLTATIRGRAILRNDDQRLQPGLFVRLRLPGSSPHEAILIPDAAVTVDQSDRVVYVLNSENKVEPRIITTGEMSHGLRIIRSGLKGDERVMLAGQTRVRPGDEVEPIEQTVTAQPSDLPDQFEPLTDQQFVERYGRMPGLTPPDSDEPYDPAPPVSARQPQAEGGPTRPQARPLERRAAESIETGTVPEEGSAPVR